MAAAKLAVKRRIQVKSLVTEGLKKSLLKQIDAYEAQEKQRGESISKRLKTLKQDNVTYFELQSMLQKLEDVLEQVPARRESISNLKKGSVYNMGVVEGMVNLTVGEDFFKKVYGYEVLLEDGVIKEIKQNDVAPFAPLNP